MLNIFTKAHKSDCLKMVYVSLFKASLHAFIGLYAQYNLYQYLLSPTTS